MLGMAAGDAVTDRYYGTIISMYTAIVMVELNEATGMHVNRFELASEIAVEVLIVFLSCVEVPLLNAC